MILLNRVEVKPKVFPNGETFLDLEKDIFQDDKNTVTLKYSNDSEFFLLGMVADVIKNNKPEATLNLEVPYMPYSRMDRVDKEAKNPFSLRVVANLINSCGFDNVFVLEAHSDVTSELMPNAGIVDFSIDETCNILSSLEDGEEYTIAFPDKGARKRYGDKIEAQFPSHQYIKADKVRNFETGRIESLKFNEVEKVNETAIIVDDLTSYGGTFVKASKALRELGAKKVILIVAHTESVAKKGELFENIDSLITTNSIWDEEPDNTFIEKGAVVQVVSYETPFNREYNYLQ